MKKTLTLVFCILFLGCDKSELKWDLEKVGRLLIVITSSAISPMAGGGPAVIAMLAKAFAGLGKTVYTYVGSELIEAEVVELQYEQKSETT